MNYIEFYRQWRELGCFSTQQLSAWTPRFNRVNLHSWVKKGFITKLRNGWYAFTERISEPDFSQYIANRIYSPSYISLHTALAHYGIIPEAVIKITSVTTLKPTEFSNAFGEYTYQSVKKQLMFGYEPKIMSNGRSIMFATPEKALLDLLYLYPFYNTTADMLNLRLDEDYMQEDFNKQLLLDYAREVGSAALNSRIDTLLNTYNL